MPHLLIEVTPGLLAAPDSAASLLPAIQDIHGQFARLGYARLDDMKSRVLIVDAALAGADPQAQFIVATLSMTQPRTDAMQRAMGTLLHARLQRHIEERHPDCRWQCCVFFRNVGSDAYIKSQSR